MKTLGLPFFILCCLMSYTSAKCMEKLYNFQNIFTPSGFFGRRGSSSIQQIICENITSDLVLNFEYQVQPYRQELVIKNSVISKIPTNSSLSKFTDIKVLVLSDVSLEEIEPGAFEGLVKLEKLDLSVNKLSKITAGIFSNLKTLRTLYIYDNKINKIGDDSFNGLGNLQDLYLNGNQLSSLDESLFTSLESLENLWISENPLVEFSIRTLSNLQQIIADKTHLKKLNINFTKSFPRIVNFTRSRLDNLDFENFSNVTFLNFDQNNITFTQNWNKSNSKYVSLQYNNLTFFDISENVEGLYLSHNKIKFFGNTFTDKEKNLRQMDLAYNFISEISSSSLKGLTHLEILDLSHNKMSILRENTFTECPILRELYLFSNNIETIEPGTFNNLGNLYRLDISENNLKSLKAPILLELKKADVVVGNVEFEWDYIKMLIKDSDDLSIVINEQFWKCQYLNFGNRGNEIKYITKNNIDSIVCYYNKN